MRQLAGREGVGTSLGQPVLKVSNAVSDCLSGDCSCVITPSGAVAPCKRLLTAEKWPNGLEMGSQAAFVEAEKYHCLKLEASNG